MTQKKVVITQNVIERLPIDKLPRGPETFIRSFRFRSSRASAFGQRRVGMRPFPKHLRRTHSPHERKKNTGNHVIDMSVLTKKKWLLKLKVALSRKCSHNLKLAADIRELKGAVSRQSSSFCYNFANYSPSVAMELKVLSKEITCKWQNQRFETNMQKCLLSVIFEVANSWDKL